MVPGELKRYRVATFTATGSTEVLVDVSGLKQDSLVIVCLNTVAGTPAGHPYISTKSVANQQLGFKAAAGDTSTYDVYLYV